MPHQAREQDRFEELRPALRRWLRLFGLVLVVALVCTGITYGPDPLIRVGSSIRLTISVFGCLALAGFALLGGLLVGEWLLERYSDTRKTGR